MPLAMAARVADEIVRPERGAALREVALGERAQRGHDVALHGPVIRDHLARGPPVPALVERAVLPPCA